MSTRTSSADGRQAAPFLAARCTRWRQHPAKWTSGCFPLTKEMTPFFQPVITLALSQPKEMQLPQGICWEANSWSTKLKIFSPVAEPSHARTANSSELTMRWCWMRTTRGNNFLSPLSLLPSVAMLNGKCCISWTRLNVCKADNSFVIAVAFWRQHLMSFAILESGQITLIAFVRVSAAANGKLCSTKNSQIRASDHVTSSSSRCFVRKPCRVDCFPLALSNCSCLALFICLKQSFLPPCAQQKSVSQTVHRT